MRLYHVHSILWSNFLFLWALQCETEANSPVVCEDEKDDSNFDDIDQISSVQGYNVEEAAVIDHFHCLLYPANILNCSWSFDTFQADTQLSFYYRVCDNYATVHSLNHTSVERVGSRSLTLRKYEMLYVILQFNITLQDKWTVYTSIYNMAMREVLPPPQNISALVKDGDLLVTWALPYSRLSSKSSCFEYQLDIGDQERPKDLVNQLSYTEPNADPNHTYRVRMRTRMVDMCQENPHWSNWSVAVTVEQSIYKLSTLVIVSISLGIPMILLAVLLLVRYQRVSKVLFPPIPRPPPKYINFLEKNDAHNFFNPAPSAEPVEEEITQVEDTEQNPGKTL